MSRPSRFAVALFVTAVTLNASPASATNHNTSIGGFDGPSLDAVASSGTPGSSPPPGQGTTSTSNGRTTRVVQAPPPDCRYYPDRTGPEMAAIASTFIGPVLPAWPAAAQEHATDLDGRWYRPDCVWSSGTRGTPDTLDARRRVFITGKQYLWSGTAPPAPPVPVADLIELARDDQQVPTPVVELNPAGQTVTGLRTWVWPTGGALQPVTARAESGPNWAQVTATPGRLVLSAPAGAEVGPCTDPKVWSTGQPDDATDCYVTFRRSSAGLPGGTATVDVAVTWTVRLTTSDGIDNGDLGTIVRSGQVRIGVAEVQSVLR